MKKTLETTIREMRLKEVSDLYYGTDKARDTYAKDTPGQTPGVEHDPIQHQHKPELAVDGVPVPGGMIKKPNLTATMKKEDLQYDLSEKEIGDILESVAEQMSPEQRKKAAAKIFQMHQDKKAAQALKKKSDPAAKAARRDAAGYKTSDDSHLDSKPKAPEKKRGRGEKDLPHIVSQLRGVVDTKDGKPSSVKFKDGTTKSVKPKHAAAWLKKHDSAKPADKLSMYKSHDSHSSFKQYAKEAIEEDMSKKCGEGEYWCNKDQKCKPIPKGMKVDKDGILMKEDKMKCMHCDGTGKHEGKECPKCEGKGYMEEAKGMKVKNCGCGEDPCKTYGSKEEQMKNMQEAGRWDQTSSGRAYRRLSPEEKARRARANMVARRAKAMKGDEDYVKDGKMRKPTIGGAKSVYKGKKTRREQVEAMLSHLETFAEEKMIGHEYQQQMKKHGKMDPNVKKAVTSVYDKKPLDKKYENDPQVKRAKRYMKIEQAIKEATYDQVLKHRYRSNDSDDSPHQQAYLGRDKERGMKTYKVIPGSPDGKKGKMAAIKKQLKRRPKDYGIDGKHDPLYPANQSMVQKMAKRQKSKKTAGQYSQTPGKNLAGDDRDKAVASYKKKVAAGRAAIKKAGGVKNYLAQKKDK